MRSNRDTERIIAVANGGSALVKAPATVLRSRSADLYRGSIALTV